MKRCSVALVLALSAGAALAAPIYRCGNTYSQTPCPNGKLIDSADPRSAAHRAEARRLAERERRLAVTMERDRLAREAAQKPALATGLDSRAPSPPAQARKPATPKAGKAGTDHPGAGRDFVAIDPIARKSAARK